MLNHFNCRCVIIVETEISYCFRNEIWIKYLHHLCIIILTNVKISSVLDETGSFSIMSGQTGRSNLHLISQNNLWWPKNKIFSKIFFELSYKFKKKTNQNRMAHFIFLHNFENSKALISTPLAIIICKRMLACWYGYGEHAGEGEWTLVAE